MAANSGALVQALIDGGLNASAAKIIASAVANAASPSLSQTRDISDATPAQDLRLIDADARRYQFTNLDYSTEAPYESRLRSAPGRFVPNDADHPYKDSQPITPVPPLSQAATTGGKYIDVQNSVAEGAPLATVNLKVGSTAGSHLRLNPATNAVDGVPLEFVSPQGFVTGTVNERNQSTQIELAVRQLQSQTLLKADGTTVGMWGWVNSAVQSTTAISSWIINNILSLTSASQVRDTLSVGEYRSGTWTPVYRATTTNPVLTYNTAQTFGDWVRIGNVVWVWGRVTISGVTSAGSGFLSIDGLPFAALNSARGYGSGPVVFRFGFTTNSPEFVYTSPGTTAFVLPYFIGNGIGLLTEANLSSTADMIFSLNYLTAAA